MTPTYVDQVMDAVRATALRAPTSLSWFGKRAPELPPAVRRGLPSKSARHYLLSVLQARLYTSFYCTGSAVPVRSEGVPQGRIAATQFLKELGAANTGKGSSETGWQVLGEQGGECELIRDGLRIWVRSGQCVCDVENGGETSVRLRLPTALLDLSPGHYMALGDVDLSPESADEIVRVYWHVTAGGAAALLRAITRSLNRAGVPFRFKTLMNPSDYIRCDAAVLYIRKWHYEVLRVMLDPIYREVAPLLRWRTPMFTKALAPGLGIAEQPASGDSFGKDRCRVLADGLLRAHELGRISPDERLEVVLDSFRRASIRLDAPYLNPGSTDSYHFCLEEHEPKMRAPRPEDGVIEHQLRPRLLRTAETIGQQLCEQAVWHEDRCNWLGPMFAAGASEGQWTYGSLGPDLYGGSTGIAIFCAQLYGVTKACEFRRTAVGALRHAMSRAELQLGPRRLGLYTGWTGLAYAAVYAGRGLGEDELVETGARLSARVVADAAKCQAFDIIDGTAGVILGLLAIYGLSGDEALLGCAVHLGRGLAASAQRREAGCSWSSPDFPRWRDLLGYSHGAAGAAAALIELYGITLEPAFEQAARNAFEYERHWFDESEANWPDLRNQYRRRKPNNVFSTTWCHGAPGIALSRLRAHQVLHIPECKREALVALDTTRRHVETMLGSGTPADFCLCHGLCGNADVLHQGSVVFSEEFPAGKAAALRIAAAGIERYIDGDASWPCGPGGSGSPSLLTGLAGIGQFYLRLYDGMVPSVLLFAGTGRHGQTVQSGLHDAL